MTVRGKLLLVTLFPAALLAILAGGLLLSLQRLQVARERVTACGTVTRYALELDLLTGDYLHGQRPRAQEQWRTHWSSLLAQTEALDVPRAEGQAVLARMRKNLQALSDLFEDLVAAPPAGAVYRRRLSNQITARSNALVSEASRLTGMSNSEADQIENRTWGFLTAVAVTALAATLGGSYAIAGRIVLRLRKLEHTAKAIGAGDLERRVGSIHNDEIGQLAREFDTMTDKLQDELTYRRQAEENLQQVNDVLRSIQQINELIVREDDRRRLVASACDILVSTRRFKSAWIAVLDGEGGLVTAAQAGVGDDFSQILEQIGSGSLPPCAAKAFEQQGVISIERHGAFCHGCPLEAGHKAFPVLATRLEHAGRIHGVLVVYGEAVTAFPAEESSLFQELADDLGLALHKFELEQERSRLEAQFLQAQKMEAVGRLAGGIAHDFRNQLTVIGGYCDLLLREVPGEGPLHEWVSEINKAARRSEKLTAQLLAFSRKQVLQPKVISLNDVVKGIAKPIASMLGEDVEFSMALAEDLGAVEADPAQLEQAVMNLAANARDAMPEGGKLHLDTVNTELAATQARGHSEITHGRYAMLAVSDTGAGMDTETLDRIFEPFFTTKERGKGTGLGLSMVYGFVKQSGGSIFVYSESGRGTTFKLYFPRSGGAAEPTTSQQATEEARPRGSETILLVEDDESVRGLARQVLLECGYSVLDAASAEQAVSVVEEHSGKIDLLLTDVVMPGASGLELAEKILDDRSEMKVLFMSGHTANVTDRRGLAMPGANLLSKPFSPNALTQAVRRTLDACAPAEGEA